MAEKVVLVCDICGQQAVQSVSMKVDGRSLVKDLCEKHLSDITAGARPARPGRRRAAATAPKRNTAVLKKSGTRKGTGGGRRRKVRTSRAKG